MLTLCAWCGCVLLPDGRTKSRAETTYMLSTCVDEISHGVCLKCKAALISEAKEEKLRKVAFWQNRKKMKL
jgi:hypothetical protein